MTARRSRGFACIIQLRFVAFQGFHFAEGLSMRTALYYPHTKIQSEGLLKTALLLWDRLEFIVPSPNHKPHYTNKQVSEAIELIGVQRHPSEEEKRELHAQIEDFATRPLPPAFYYRPAHPDYREYAVYPEKLLPETWDLLQQAQLTSIPAKSARYPLQEAAGLSIMALLADCCAGETRARVTDRGIAYATVTNLLLQEKAPREADYDIVVPLTLKLVNTSDLSLKALLAFRKRESKSKGHEMRDLRHRYIQRIEGHIKGICSKKKLADRKDLERQFEEDMRDDLLHLRDELKIARQNVWASKDVIVTAVAGAAIATAWGLGLPLAVPAALTAAGAPVTIGGILRTKNDFATTRKSIMQKHPMAYMYELEQFAIH